ncbi:MAG TPA: hypothetical protein VF613_13105, partial [Longimicrobium sp.]
ILLVLMIGSAGCGATSGRKVTWLKTEPILPTEPDVHARIFWFDRQWDVGVCSLGPGSHVTLTRGGDVRSLATGLGLSTTANGAEWRYGITMLAADGTTLAHFPSDRNARVFVANIPAHSKIISGTNMRISPRVYDRVARVLVHATCHGRP